jgi:hypothetical protein
MAADNIVPDKAAASEEAAKAPKAKTQNKAPAKAPEVDRVDAPYPTQADLDAMKSGRFKPKNRSVKAKNTEVEYETR